MILLSCEWQNVINGIPCFCWGLLIVVGLLVGLHLCLKTFELHSVLKYVIQPKEKYRHEEESKQNAFLREMLWDIGKEEKTKNLKEIDELKKQLENLREAIYGQNIETPNNKDV